MEQLSNRAIGTGVAVGIAAVIFVILFVLDRAIRRRRTERRLDARLWHYASWAPTVVGVPTGIALVIAAVGRDLLAPALSLPDTPFGTALTLAELAIGSLFLLGFATRIAAVGLFALFVTALAQHPFLAVLEQVLFLGIAVFLFAWGRGRLSLGSVFSRLVASAPGHLRGGATRWYRFAVGYALLFSGAGMIARGEASFEAAGLLVAGLCFLFGILLRPLSALLIALFLLKGPLDNLPYLGSFAAFWILGRRYEREGAM